MATKNRREVGPWGDIKAEIIRKYAGAYTTILSKRAWCTSIYVDVFAGSPENLLRGTDTYIASSAKRVLAVQPAFSEYIFIDLDAAKVQDLEGMVLSHANAQVIHGDGNMLIRERILPRLETDSSVRALILLDPYGMELSWDVVERAGKCGRAEIIVNFPIMDINRNALHNRSQTILDESVVRMTKWWGDSSWRTQFFEKRYQADLFGSPVPDYKIVDNDQVVSAYCERLKSVAGFTHVAKPFPVRNSKNAIIYYLIYAPPKPVALVIMNGVLDKYR